jgi:phosphotransferase system enzyme I (PtsI)
MASDPFGAILLLGLGMREFSMEANSVPEIKETLHRVFLEEAEELARCVMDMDTAEDVQREVTGRFAPRLFDLLSFSE